MTDTSEDVLAHYGVKGMKWGQRKASDVGSSSSASAPARKLTQKELEEAAARRAQYKKIGYEVATAVVIGVGAVGVSSMAGPFAGAAVAAVARTAAGQFDPTANNDDKR